MLVIIFLIFFQVYGVSIMFGNDLHWYDCTQGEVMSFDLSLHDNESLTVAVSYLVGEGISKLPSDHQDSMAVYSWEDPSFWSTKSKRMTINSSASSGVLGSQSGRTPDQLLSPSSASGEDSSKLNKLMSSHGLFKMDNPLSKATSPRQRKTTMK